MEQEKLSRSPRQRGVKPLRWVVLTAALELEMPPAALDANRSPREIEAAFEAEELRGYNWLARYLSRAVGPYREAGVLSFKCVKAPPARLSVQPTCARGRIFCFAIRLRDGTEPGQAAPPWLTLALTDANATASGVRFRAITDAGESRLAGRT